MTEAMLYTHEIKASSGETGQIAEAIDAIAFQKKLYRPSTQALKPTERAKRAQDLQLLHPKEAVGTPQFRSS